MAAAKPLAALCQSSEVDETIPSDAAVRSARCILESTYKEELEEEPPSNQFDTAPLDGDAEIQRLKEELEKVVLERAKAGVVLIV
eukprot:scaffold1472_cov300-Pinguiococcus_pyrenoidosus.AAC.3